MANLTCAPRPCPLAKIFLFYLILDYLISCARDQLPLQPPVWSGLIRSSGRGGGGDDDDDDDDDDDAGVGDGGGGRGSGGLKY